MLEPDFARMRALARVGVAALCLGGGAVLGLVGTFAHQSLPPVGVAIALVTVGLYIVGLRAWGGVRTPAAFATIGVGLVSGVLATATSSSVLVPANAVGYAWLGGIAAISFVALAWPHIQRPPRAAADTMGERVVDVTTPSELLHEQPFHEQPLHEQKDRPLP